MNASDDRKARASAMLAELSNEELADVLLPELDRRRLDAAGAPKEVPGLYLATVNALMALLEQKTNVTHRYRNGKVEVDDWEAKQNTKMVERLAKVALGARLNTRRQEIVGPIREIASLVETFARSQNEERVALLVRTLEMQFGSAIDPEEIEAALQAPTVNGRVTRVALAAAIIEGDPNDEVVWRGALDIVRDALKD